MWCTMKMKSMSESQVRDPSIRFLYGIVLGLVVLAYLPTLQFSYVHQDQWRAFRYLSDGDSFSNRLSQCSSLIPPFYITTGRPLVWLTECFEHALVNDLSDFVFLRPVALAVVLFTVIYITSVLRQFVGESAIVIAAFLTVSPAYAFMYLQGLTALMVLVSVIFATASFDLLGKSMAGGTRISRHLVISSLLFLLACMMYASFAFIVLPLAVIKLMSTALRGSKRVKQFALSLALYGLLSALYLVIVRISILALGIFRDVPDVGDNYRVSADFAPRAIAQRGMELADVVFWNSPVNLPTFPGAALMILMSYIMTTRYQDLDPSRRNNTLTTGLFRCLTFVFICSMMLLSMSPVVFSRFSGVGTRHLLPVYLLLSFAATVVVSRVLQSALKLTERRAAFVLVALMIVPVSIVQNRNSFIEISSAQLEVEMIRNRFNIWLQNKVSDRNRFILVVRPEQYPGLYKDHHLFASGANPVSIPWMINAILREKLSDREFVIADCGFEVEACVATALTDPNKIAVAYAGGRSAPNTDKLYCPFKPFVVNISSLTSRPVNVDQLGNCG